jgi:hypothetical protein
VCFYEPKTSRKYGERGEGVKNSYKEKQRRPPSKKKKRGKNLSPRNRKACMPHHEHCPPAKRRGDRNPKYHEEQQKDVT